MRILALLFFSCFVLSLQAAAYYTFEENGRVGLKNDDGVVVIPAAYEALGWSDGTFSIVDNVTGYRMNNQWGIVTVTHVRKTMAEFFELYPAEGALLIASRRQAGSLRINTGCLDVSGKVVLPLVYAGIRIHGLRAITYTVDGNNRLKYGLVNLENKAILPAHYQYIYPLGSLRYAVQNTENKTALFTENGIQVTPFSIDSIGVFHQDVALFFQSGLQGVVNRMGEIIIEAKYREIRLNPKPATGRLPHEWTIHHATGVPWKKLAVDSIVVLGPGQLKWVTANGDLLVSTKADTLMREPIHHLGTFVNGRAVFTVSGKQGVLKRDGRQLLPAVYRGIILGEDYLLISEGGGDTYRWALYDTLGNRVSKHLYDRISPLTPSHFVVTKKGFQGVLNRDGLEQIACVYDSIVGFRHPWVVVKFRGQYGIISESERWRVTPQANPITVISDDRYLMKAGSLTYLKDMDGTVLYFTSNPVAAHNNRMEETLASGGKWTINLNGQIIKRELPPTVAAETVWPSTEGLRMIKRNNRYGFVDEEGRLRIPNRYEEARPFSQGLAAIKIRNRWGFIDAQDRIVIQPAFDDVSAFDNGYCKVKYQDKAGLISATGGWVIPARYDQLEFLPSGRIRIVQNDLQGVADGQGNVLLHPKYNSIEELSNGFFIVSQEKHYGVLNQHGLPVIPQVYDYLFFFEDTYYACKKSRWEALK
jgi:hypothetical protein